jgi:hypothetical protein
MPRRDITAESRGGDIMLSEAIPEEPAHGTAAIQLRPSAGCLAALAL